MPELPDVEGFRRTFARYGEGQTVERVEVLDRGLLRNTSPQTLGRALKGHRFREPRRHGKWLLAGAGDVTVLMHFGMTGLVDWARSDVERHSHDRIVFRLRGGGELRYRNMRRLGGVWLAGDERACEAVTGPLGPDAVAVGEQDFEALVTRRRGGVKAALMDQALIAGLGNLLADEMLWRARIHPRTQVRSLSKARRERLYRAMHDTVRESIPTGRVPALDGWLTRVRDRRDAECPRCLAPLRRSTVAGRTSCWCPRCQR